MWQDFIYCFIPIFVAVDPIGVLPLYLNLAHSLDKFQARKILLLSILTATLVALLFLVAGKKVLLALGISIADFQIAGGVILFVLSLIDIVSPHKDRRAASKDGFGVVPLGVPIIVGPAVLATLILLSQQYGRIISSLALVANLFITWLIFRFAGQFTHFLGDAGVRIISKIGMMLLASIGVMMIRKGVQSIITGG